MRKKRKKEREKNCIFLSDVLNLDLISTCKSKRNGRAFVRWWENVMLIRYFVDFIFILER